MNIQRERNRTCGRRGERSTGLSENMTVASGSIHRNKTDRPGGPYKEKLWPSVSRYVPTKAGK